MKNISINIDRIYNFVKPAEVTGYKEDVQKNILALKNKTGKGNDFLGWVNLPSSIPSEMISDIEATAKKLREQIDILVVVGIGGSYLGAKSFLEALSNTFLYLQSKRKDPVVLFAGQNIGEDYTVELLELLDNYRYGIVVISKSGTTTEPALAFRIFQSHLEKKVGEVKAKELIVAVTDASRGALRTLAVQKGYKTFVIPDDVGGRYSVLTPVGLLPIAVAGFDIRQFINGAKDMESICGNENEFENNPAAIYAAARNALYKKGYKIELMANYNNKLHFLAEWWKQLYGESEGKENKGIFPASVDLTADLHSMGQYIQEGERSLFETVLSVVECDRMATVPSDPQDLDKLNFLTGKRIDYVNKMAELGTAIAHVDGGVPNIRIDIPRLNEYYLGQLMYFFEIACGISGYILGVNPFDQPGVEAYKKNMFALLEKPGFEEETRKLKSRL